MQWSAALPMPDAIATVPVSASGTHLRVGQPQLEIAPQTVRLNAQHRSDDIAIGLVNRLAWTEHWRHAGSPDPDFVGSRCNRRRQRDWSWR